MLFLIKQPCLSLEHPVNLPIILPRNLSCLALPPFLPCPTLAWSNNTPHYVSEWLLFLHNFLLSCLYNRLFQKVASGSVLPGVETRSVRTGIDKDHVFVVVLFTHLVAYCRKALVAFAIYITQLHGLDRHGLIIQDWDKVLFGEA